eukprot:CCRYP_005004-RB/>CCRYP_005004-RB protein AED:0.04 eAED:0.04 QI:4606/0.92/0.93/1/0.35/0.26/15/2034/1703
MATLSPESAPDVVGLNDDPPSDHVDAACALLDVHRPPPVTSAPQQQIGDLAGDKKNGGEITAGAPSCPETSAMPVAPQTVNHETSAKNPSSSLEPQHQSPPPPKENKQAESTKNLSQQRKTPEKSPRRRLSSNLYLSDAYRQVHSNMVTICSKLCTVYSFYDIPDEMEKDSVKPSSIIDSSVQSMQSNAACKVDLPSLIAQELDWLKSKIESTMHEIQRRKMDENGQSNNEDGEALLANAMDVLERTKQSSIDLAGMFYALNEKHSKGQVDSKKELAVTVKPSPSLSATEKTAKTSIDISQSKHNKGKRASKGLKQLGVIRKRQSVDNSDEIQFLSNQATSTKDFDDKTAAPGYILGIAARVTDGGATPMEDMPGSRSADEDVTDERLGERLDHDAFMNGFPSMAPPMTLSDIGSKYDSGVLDESVYTSFIPKIRDGKKKGTKRRRTDNHNNKEVIEDAPPRSKKKRARSSKSRKESTDNDALKRSDSLMSTDSRASDYPTDIRVLPDPTPRPKTHVIDGDDNPQRICNPLLTLPQFPSGSDPPLDEIPTGGELWNIANLQFADPDTYPISYLARLLGFDVPEVGNGVPFAQEFDPMTVSVMKSDPWMAVPDAGSFCDEVWKKCDNDDVVLSYMDPLWANILQTFTGYNENDFKDAGKGYQTHLSPLVLEFAEERGILTKDQISFRMATLEDEDSLRRLEEKCQGRHLSKQDLATCLRTPGNFCIIAESANHVPLAFVQYRFCWYKVEEKKAGSNQMTSYGVKSLAGEAVDKISELVFVIDNVVYIDSFEADRIDDTTNAEANANPISQADVETSRILLVSLSLIHAWSHNIWYGMMESPSPLVPFYVKYFRMITVGKHKTGHDSDASTLVPLVCDLKKCSFRYAIHLREESLKSSQLAQSSNAAQSSVIQRMMVHISDTFDVSKSLQKSTVGGSTVASTFSNASSKSQAKQIQIRIPTSQANESYPEIMSVSTVDGQEMISKIDIASLEVSASWTVFKLFSRIGEEPKPETTHCVKEDFFLAELMKKQKELQTLETSIEDTSRHLLSEAYKDCLDFQLGDRKHKREREKKLLKDFEAVKQRLHEADLAWQAQLEQDMDAVCDVCWDGEVTPENQIIFCDSCNVAVHQGCYGIDKVPSGNYFCHPCIYYGKNNEFLAAERREGPRSAPTRTPIVCELCPRRQGAFVQTVTAADSLRKPRWVHVGCAKWQGVHYVDIELKDKIEDLTELKQTYQNLGHSCALCKSNIGALHQCRAEGCKKWLHLTCARCVGTCSVQHGENCEGPYAADSIPFPVWSLACIEHSEVDPESIRKNSVSVEQLRAIAKSYPPEPVPPKPFYKMNAKERREYWAESDNLATFFENVMSNKFGAQCNVWNTLCHPVDGQEGQELNTTAIVMGHGRSLISHQYHCIVCCMDYGAKVGCSKEGCIGPSGKKKEPLKMHVTCARAAGFEVAHHDDKGFYLRCFHHSENGNNLRARLEDMLEVEIQRSPNKKFDKSFAPMSWEHAASIFHSAVSVLRVLGWAWRWAEWWVAEGDNWEPLLEEGQVEENMTDEELRKIPSTPDSRCKDARQCRLAALGAALRNRDYDKEEGDDQQPLERGLRAVLSVPSLVGPLRKKEIDFFVTWLSLAYRSKSPWLGFGDDKIPVANDSFCVHIGDGTPKYELGSRPLPGKAEPCDIKSNFEPTVEEVDDFLKIREKGEMKKY